MPTTLFNPPRKKKKTIIRKKIDYVPPHTGTKDEMWAVKGVLAQKRANKRRDKLIEAAMKREKAKKAASATKSKRIPSVGRGKKAAAARKEYIKKEIAREKVKKAASATKRKK